MVTASSQLTFVAGRQSDTNPSRRAHVLLAIFDLYVGQTPDTIKAMEVWQSLVHVSTMADPRFESPICESDGTECFSHGSRPEA